MNDDMRKSGLIWAIVLSVMAAACLLATFWNPSHFLTFAISSVLAIIFWVEYKESKEE